MLPVENGRTRGISILLTLNSLHFGVFTLSRNKTAVPEASHARFLPEKIFHLNLHT